MARIVINVKIYEDGDDPGSPFPTTTPYGSGLRNLQSSVDCQAPLCSVEHGKQVERALFEYFDALIRENPDATAVADALSHEQSGIGTITIQQDFTTGSADPDEFYKQIINMNVTGGPHGNLR